MQGTTHKACPESYEAMCIKKIQEATNVKGGTSLLIDIQVICSSYIFTMFSTMFISNDSVTLQEL